MRILFLSYFLPWPTTNGAAQRTNLIHRSLSELGEVDMLLLIDPSLLDTHFQELLRDQFGLVKCVRVLDRGERGIWKPIRLISKSLAERLAHHLGGPGISYATDPNANAALEACLAARRYDLVVGRYSMSVAKSGVLGRMPVVLDIDDLDTEGPRSRLKVPGMPVWQKWVLGLQVARLERIVSSLLPQCDALWISSESDRDRAGVEGARLLPNIPFQAVGAAPPATLNEDPASRKILFIGTIAAPPILQAADFFISEVWPKVRHAAPDAELHLIGAGLTDSMRQRWDASPGVRSIGFVDDLIPHYAGCAFTVAPILSGAGTSIKVLETLAYGRTCVLTPVGLRGYERDLRHLDSVFVGASVDALAEGCIALLANPSQRAEMSRRGARIVVERYSYQRFRSVVAETIADVCHKRKPERGVSGAGSH